MLSSELEMVLGRAGLAIARGCQDSNITGGLESGAVLRLAAEIKQRAIFVRHRLTRLIRQYTHGEQMILEAHPWVLRPILTLASEEVILCLVVCPVRNDRRLGGTIVSRLRHDDVLYRLMLLDGDQNARLVVVKGR